jgi:phosphoribosylaminoimidazole-succinocarboxamide synthase
MLSEIGMTLIDFKLEFGRTSDGRVLLADEISPDTCRLWDDKTARRMDKDVFRRDLADLVETYTEVYERLRKRFPQYDVAE